VYLGAFVSWWLIFFLVPARPGCGQAPKGQNDNVNEPDFENALRFQDCSEL
jgi:hypothetical protein